MPRLALEKLAGRGWFSMDELVCPPLHVSPSPDNFVEGAWFDYVEVDKTIQQFCALRHIEGRKFANRPLRPLPWQIIHVIGPIFGWKHSLDETIAAKYDATPGSRIVRNAFVEVPRKAGKSTISSGVAIKLLAGDGEPGSQVYSAAVDRNQASIVFNAAKKMALASPQLSGHLAITGSLIRHVRSGSFYRVLSSISEAAHGLNVHGAIVDELHVHKSRDLFDTIATGMGARDQPLMLTISTADDGRPGTVFDEQHNGIVRQDQGTADPEPTTYGVIYAATEDADAFDEVTWWSCNPSMPHTPGVGYLRAEATKAKNRPAYFPAFTRLHLNQRRAGGSGMFDMLQWERNSTTSFKEESLHGARCFGGIMVSSSTDFAAVCWVFPEDLVGFDGNEHPGYRLVLRAFLPEGSVAPGGRRDTMSQQLQAWERQGWLTFTSGDAIEYSQVESAIEADLERFDVIEAAYLRWQSEQFRQRLVELRPPGFNEDDWVWPITSSIDRLAAPTEEVYRALELGVMATNGNPLLKWQATNASAKTDSEGRAKPDAKASADNISGVTALVLGVAAAIRERPTDGGSAFVML